MSTSYRKGEPRFGGLTVHLLKLPRLAPSAVVALALALLAFACAPAEEPTATPKPATPTATSAPAVAEPTATSAPGVVAKPTATSPAVARPTATLEIAGKGRFGEVSVRPKITPEIIERLPQMTMDELLATFPRKFPAEFQYEDIKRGGTFRIATTWDLSKWDPRVTAAGGTMTVTNLVYMTLVMFNTGPEADPLDPRLVPRLAESWEYSDDAKHLTFKLHQGMYWGDMDDPFQKGPEIVAQDIKWVIEEYKNNSVKAGTFSTLESIDTPDSYTLVMNFTDPSLWMLPTLGIKDTPIFNPHLFKAGRQDFEAVGPGPFILTEQKKSISVKMVRNPNYYFKDERGSPLPYMDGVDWLIVPDVTTRLALIRTGKIETGYSIHGGTPLEVRMLLRTNPDLVTVSTERPYDSPAIVFQQNDPMWGGEENADARRAIALAIDTRAIADVLSGGLTGPLPIRIPYYYFWPHMPRWEELEELQQEWYGPYRYAYDPVKARELWDKTGYGNITETLEYYAYTPMYTDSLALIVTDLKDNLGINGKPASLDYSAYNAPLAAGTLEGLFTAWAAAYPEPAGQAYQRWNVNGVVNRENINDPVLNDLTWKMLVATTQEEILRLLKPAMLRFGDMAYGAGSRYNGAISVGTYPWQPWVKNFRYGTYSAGYYYWGQILDKTWLDL